MPSHPLRFVVLLAITGLLPVTTTAADSFREALEKGEWNANLRFRFEAVDQDGFAEDAEATTLRLRLGYQTGMYHDFFAFVEFEALTDLGNDDYNSSANGMTLFPLIADPKDEEVNQVYLAYQGWEDVTLRVGRQRIKLDNERFVGPVGWRQLEQTFDAYSATVDLPHDMELFIGHVTNVNKINGAHNPFPGRANTNLTCELLHLSVPVPIGTVTGYAYLLDFEGDPLTSHKDLGVRFSGKRSLRDDVDLLYAVEFAEQSDTDDGAASIDAGYRLAEVGVVLGGITIKGSWELLEGDGLWAFQTPLATLHAFNGWADKFVPGTPAAGLEDRYVSVGKSFGPWKCLGVYHDFSSDTGGIDYGTELDLMVKHSFKEISSWGVKYASYDADMLSTDTDKLWGWLQIQF